MYEFAYNDVIEDSHQTLRARERAAMDRVIGMLRAAQEKGPQSRELIDALFYLRRLWTIFIDDLNDPNNELPDAAPRRDHLDRRLDDEGDRPRARRPDQRPDADDRNQRADPRRAEVRVIAA